ncbi:MAG TPA: class I SAM-dependent methyltransferase [Bryobacteraceae bacterium]|nr:class I SAM-dependent methyltransferase [Bryobacteraceae bacterium]
METPLSSYDDIAGMYHAFWADWYLPAATPALEKLFFSQVRPGSRVLDVCCGSGHVTKELVARGYLVTGVDLSASLIAEARKELPGAEFHVQDARALSLDGRYAAALSTFDSLNHILSIEDLRRVFTGVRKHLTSGGLFVFDMNDEQAYFLDMRQWAANVAERSVGLVRGTYDAAKKTASTELIWFKKEDTSELWTQKRSIVKQRCYASEEIVASLSDSGFRSAEAISASDAGLVSDLGFGRIFYIAWT